MTDLPDPAWQAIKNAIAATGSSWAQGQYVPEAESRLRGATSALYNSLIKMGRLDGPTLDRAYLVRMLIRYKEQEEAKADIATLAQDVVATRHHRSRAGAFDEAIQVVQGFFTGEEVEEDETEGAH